MLYTANFISKFSVGFSLSEWDFKGMYVNAMPYRNSDRAFYSPLSLPKTKATKIAITAAITVIATRIVKI